MITLLENTENQNKIEIELAPYFMKYKKPSAQEVDVSLLVKQVSYVLDLWEYTYKEVRSLDRKAFMDLMKSYYLKLTDNKSKNLFSKVFDL